MQSVQSNVQTWLALVRGALTPSSAGPGDVILMSVGSISIAMHHLHLQEANPVDTDQLGHLEESRWPPSVALRLLL